MFELTTGCVRGWWGAEQGGVRWWEGKNVLGRGEDVCRLRRALEALGKAQASGRLGAVLVRVARATGQRTEEVFTSEERARLPGALGLTEEEVASLEVGARYVFETAAFHGASGEAVAEELLGLGLDADACKTLADAWDKVGREAVDALRARTLGGPAELQATRMQTVVHLGHHGASLGRDGGAVAEFHLLSGAAAGEGAYSKDPWDSGRNASAEADHAVGGTPRDAVIHVEFDQESLLSLLVDLDHIQRAIDALSH
jgi:hypothetical protein